MPKSTIKHLIDRKSAFSEAVKILREAFEEHGYVIMRLSMARNRSLDQNALYAVWVDQVVKELGEYDHDGVRRFCKLHFGVPILRAEDDWFRELYDRAIKAHDYETKLQIMDMIDVTSRMKKDQMTRFLEAMQLHYVERGVMLESEQ